MVGLLFWAGMTADTVTLPAELRTGEELAAALSGDGRTVTAQGQALSRCSVIRLTDRSWDDAMALISEGLGVTFRSSSEGSWVMAVDPERETASARAQSALGTAMKDNYRRLQVEINELVSNPFPPSPDWTKAQIEAALRTPGVAEPRSVFAHPLFNAALPWERRGALAALQGIAASNSPELKNPGPSFYFFEKNKTVTTLMAEPRIESGDAYYWRDKAPYPAWVRERALSLIRSAEANIARLNLPPEEAAVRLEEEARWTFITHRLSVDAFTGVPTFEYSILAMGDYMGGWFDSDVIPAYTWTLQPGDLAAGNPGFAERQAATNATLDSPFFQTAAGGNGAASTFLAAIVEKEKRDIVYPIWWIRDRLVRSTSPTALRLKMPFAVGMRQIGGPLPTWTVADRNGVLVFRNELEGFDLLDWRDTRLLADYARRSEKGVMSLHELMELNAKLSEPTAPALARQQAGRLASSWLQGYAVLAALKTLPPDVLEPEIDKLKAGNKIQLDLGLFSAGTRTKLHRGLQLAFREDPQAGTLIRNEERHAIATQVFAGPSTLGFIQLQWTENTLHWIIRMGASKNPPEWMSNPTKFPKTVGEGKIEKISLN